MQQVAAAVELQVAEATAQLAKLRKGVQKDVDEEGHVVADPRGLCRGSSVAYSTTGHPHGPHAFPGSFDGSAFGSDEWDSDRSATALF